jgi:hypothetical protein
MLAREYYTVLRIVEFLADIKVTDTFPVEDTRCLPLHT